MSKEVTRFFPKKDWELLKEGVQLGHIRSFLNKDCLPETFKGRPEENPIVKIRMIEEEEGEA